MLYVPGRSVMVAARSGSPDCPASLKVPDFFSTVTPGKLPVFWRKPVNALNNVDLPALGLPTSATFIFPCFNGEAYNRNVSLIQAQSRPPRSI